MINITKNYFWNGKKIAKYDSKDGIIYLNSSLLGGDFQKTCFERMKESVYSEAFSELIKLLSINEETKLSEFF